MNLIGEKVKHKKFGAGTVIAQEASCISVKFVTEDCPKKFAYPSCFKTFLKLLDENVDIRVNETIKEHEETEYKRKQQEHIEAEARYFSKKMNEKVLKSGKTADVCPFASVEEFCSSYRRETTAEIVYLKTKGGKRQQIFDGKRVEYKNGRFVYTFEADEELTYPDSTPISIWQGKDSITGYIVGCEEFTVIIATGVNLGEEVPELEFSAEPWHLLNSLNDRLDEILINPSGIAKK